MFHDFERIKIPFLKISFKITSKYREQMTNSYYLQSEKNGRKRKDTEGSSPPASYDLCRGF